jgi:hypothetical protein
VTLVNATYLLSGFALGGSLAAVAILSALRRGKRRRAMYRAGGTR